MSYCYAEALVPRHNRAQVKQSTNFTAGRFLTLRSSPVVSSDSLVRHIFNFPLFAGRSSHSQW